VGEAEAVPSKDGFGSVAFERKEERASEENGGREGGWRVGRMGRGAREERGVSAVGGTDRRKTPKAVLLARLPQLGEFGGQGFDIWA